MLVDVNVYRFDRDRRSGLVIDRHRDRHEFRFVGRRVVGEVDASGFVGPYGSETVVRNYGPGRNGNGVGKIATGGIGVVDDERNAL